MLSVDVVVADAYQARLCGVIPIRTQPSAIQVHDDGHKNGALNKNQKVTNCNNRVTNRDENAALVRIHT